METAGGGQTSEIRTELDERLRQCISETLAPLVATALSSLFAQPVRVVDLWVRVVVIAIG